MLIVDVSNPASPSLAKNQPRVNAVDGVDRAGNYLLSMLTTGVTLISDVTNPESPLTLGSFPSVFKLGASGNYLMGLYSDTVRVIDISNPAAPFTANYWLSPGFANRAGTATANWLLTTEWNGRLDIFDITDVMQPSLVSQYRSPEYMAAYDMQIRDRYAMIASANGLRVVDVSDSTRLDVVATLDLGRRSRQIALSGNYAYMLADSLDLAIVDISNPLAPAPVSTLLCSGYSQDLTVSGNHVYIADGDQGLTVVDVSDPATPFIAGHSDLGLTAGHYAFCVEVSGNYAYLSGHSREIFIADITEPTNPQLAGVYTPETSQWIEDILINGNRMYLSDSRYGMQIFDLSDPLAPILLGGVADNYQWYALPQSLRLVGNYLYQTDYGLGLRIINVANPTDPYVAGQFKTLPGWSMESGIFGQYALIATDNGLLRAKFSSPICGDVDASGGVDISDAIAIIQYIFSAGYVGHIPAQADVNCDGSPDISDVVYLISYIFGGGPAPCAGCK